MSSTTTTTSPNTPTHPDEEHEVCGLKLKCEIASLKRKLTISEDNRQSLKKQRQDLGNAFLSFLEDRCDAEDVQEQEIFAGGACGFTMRKMLIIEDEMTGETTEFYY